MKKNTVAIVVVLLVIALGGGILIAKSYKKPAAKTAASTSTSSTTQTTADPNTVHIKDLDFATKTLTVKKGTTVTWANDDTARHTITFDDSAMSSADSQLFSSGETYKHTFDTAGSFSYHCSPHPFMKGTIVVTE